MTIEMRSRFGLYYKKLASVGIWSGIRHRKGSLNVCEFRCEFVFEFLPVYAFSTHSGTGWIASLDH
ncbi:MAG: hypothetical protein ACD_78C00338G0001, partial [uncultured bacterium (gcode 4)]